MLKITRTEKDGFPCLQLEGKLLGLWVDEVRAVLDRESTPIDRLLIDLSEVTFVDSYGLGMLREMITQGCTISKRSNFVAELLRLEKLQ